MSYRIQKSSRKSNGLTKAGNYKKDKNYRVKIIFPEWDKPKYKSLKTNDERVAKARAKELHEIEKCELYNLSFPGICKENINKYLLDFIESKERDLNKKYIVNLKGIIERLIKECKWDYLTDVNIVSFENWVKKHRDLSNKTLNEYLIGINNFLNWCVKRDYLIKNQLSKLDKFPYKPVLKRRSFTLEEFRSLIKVAPLNRRAVYITFFFTGIRNGEMSKICWGDVYIDNDLDNCYIYLSKEITKNKKEAVQPLVWPVIEILKLIRPDRYYKDDLLFPYFDKEFRKLDNYKDDLKKAGIEYINRYNEYLHFYSLRKSLSTILLTKGAPMRSVTELMRHSNIGITQKHYIDSRQFSKRDTLKYIPEFLNKQDLLAPNNAPCLVINSQNMSLNGKVKANKTGTKSSKFEAKSQKLSGNVIKSHKNKKSNNRQGFNLQPSELCY